MTLDQIDEVLKFAGTLMNRSKSPDRESLKIPALTRITTNNALVRTAKPRMGLLNYRGAQDIDRRGQRLHRARTLIWTPSARANSANSSRRS